MDKIIIKGLKLYAYHGVNPEEKRDGQEFIIDLNYYVDITKACHLDDLSDTVSYAKVIKTVRRVFTAEKYDLIGTGGSDFHGTNKPYIKLSVGKGNLKIPYEILENIKKTIDADK